ncbi:MAG: Mur ligase domain-containing protein [Bacteroidales bacterium]|nr:Mur ligase domain-containing protein [Bacteroidales bacterium]
MKIHLIAIGGSAMHNLAIALKEKGYEVTGSDDEIFEPSRTRLKNHGLLPDKNGWYPANIHEGLDIVILGMHARADNPELKKAQELGLKIFSYPEYLYEQSKDKCRVVIGGSHGKTTITAMVMHVLRACEIDFDYMVGAQLDGFDTMVRLSENAKIAVFEGDEYLSSPVDPRPKFHLYQPNIALITGIEWDHINVFPTFDNYVEQFSKFIELIKKDGTLIYCEEDEMLEKIVKERKRSIRTIPYHTHPYRIKDGKTYLETNSGLTELLIFGGHNMQNISGALQICLELGVTREQFYRFIRTFKGAAKRLQTLAQNDHTHVFFDFAHSPSKLKATVKAVKQQYPSRRLIACMELHTFSSLSESFMEEYRNSMIEADEAWIYYNPETIKHKKLSLFTEDAVYHSFGTPNIKVFTDSKLLLQQIKKTDWSDKNLLIMTSGNFNGVDFSQLKLSGHQINL